MSEKNGQPPVRGTIWVTIVGGLFLAFGILNAIEFLASLFLADDVVNDVAKFKFDGPLRRFTIGGSLVIGLIFAYGGLTTLYRWGGWRVWYGLLAWGMIVSVVLSSITLMHIPSSGEPTPKEVLTFFLIQGLASLVIAVLALVAKRAEKPPS